MNNQNLSLLLQRLQADGADQVQIYAGDVSVSITSQDMVSMLLSAGIQEPAPLPVGVKKTLYTTVNLNVRSGPSLDFSILDMKRAGTPVDVEWPAVGDWYKLFGVNRYMYASYLKEPPAPPIVVVPQPEPQPVPAQTGHSKLSFHVMPGGNLDRIYQVMGRLYDAGRAIPGCTLVKQQWQDGDPSVQAVRTASPNTEIVLRYYLEDWEEFTKQIQWNFASANTGRDMVRRYFERFIAGSLDAKKAHYHQFICEPLWGQGSPDFWMGAMDEANRLGFKVAIPQFSWGTPKTPAEGPFWSTMFPVLERCQSEGHRFCLHQYIGGDPGDPIVDTPLASWTNDWSILRHRRVYEGLPDNLKNLPVAFTEFGTRWGSRDYNAISLLQRAVQADAELKKDQQVLWAAMWTFKGGGAWAQSDLFDYLPQFEDYLLRA